MTNRTYNRTNSGFCIRIAVHCSVGDVPFNMNSNFNLGMRDACICIQEASQNSKKFGRRRSYANEPQNT
jgi:hypothetical protein